MNKYELNKEIILPNFSEFNQEGKMRFLIFKFHGYFNGLIGLDILTTLDAKMDLANKTLITNNAVIPVLYKPNFMSQTYSIPARTKFIARLPVNVQSRDIYMRKLDISQNCLLPRATTKQMAGIVILKS